MLSDWAPVKRVYRSWDDDDKGKILAEALRLRESQPGITDLNLLRLAQKVLSEDKQRTLPNIKMPSYDWFRAGLTSKPTKPEKPTDPKKPAEPPKPIDPEPPKPQVSEIVTDLMAIEVFRTVVEAIQVNTLAIQELREELRRQNDRISRILRAVESQSPIRGTQDQLTGLSGRIGLLNRG